MELGQISQNFRYNSAKPRSCQPNLKSELRFYLITGLVDVKYGLGLVIKYSP